MLKYEFFEHFEGKNNQIRKVGMLVFETVKFLESLYFN